ncbi:hypothetical protein LOD99_415 [Oopsacas minuta]|uniref:Signal peptidase complex subunit 3 n=1 Tax=Oopsacas minuta TaxID=111878 RepID=A0AAV7K9B3_9METZ|nr:hypothetical protein LOD99_415 [Oopsacas minuta]
MNTVLARLNAIFAFSLTVLAVCAFLLFITSIPLNNFLNDVTILPSQVKVRNVREFPRSPVTSDLGYLVFDLSANLSGLFHWNCKEVFLYLTAEYQTEDNTLNQIILWDSIILRHGNLLLDYRNMNTKYPFFDDGHGLRGRNISLILSWNTIPNAGMLPMYSTDRDQVRFSFPRLYE